MSAAALSLPDQNGGALIKGAVALNRAIMRIVAALAVALMVVETIVLFTGVVSRYYFHRPIVWSDELAQILFIWMTMFGVVIAMDRGEHMRLTAVVARFSKAGQLWLETMSLIVVLLFSWLVLMPGIEHMSAQMAITSPALSMPDGYRVAAIPVGFALIVFSSLVRLISSCSLKTSISCVAVAALTAYVFWYFAYDLQDLGNLNLVLFFFILLGACVLGGVPIAFAFGIATLAYIVNIAEVPTSIVVSRFDEGVSHLILLAVPLFVLLGVLLQLSGMAKALIDFMSSLLGHIKGGLQYVLLGAMFLVSGISGSKVADMAAVAPALFPEMKKQGADENELAALLAASGAMTETIPPSLVLITVGAVCGVSISALFIGGLMPAFACTVVLGFVCWRRARTVQLKNVKRAPFRQILRTFVIALPVLVLPILIRICVIEGIATATEVATVGVVYVCLYSVIANFFIQQIPLKNVYPLMVEAASLSGAILLIIGVATAMAWALTQSGFSHALVDLMTHLPGGSMAFLAVSIVLFIVLGSVLEGIPAIVLFGPLIFPAAHALNINEVHYSMVIILAMGIGLFAPPLGIGFYAASAISKVNADLVIPRMWMYLGVLTVMVFVVAFIPWLSTGFLPQ